MNSGLSTSDTLQVNFLVFTRFESDHLDYKFYFVSENEHLTELIWENLIPQEGHKQLPYQAFFIYKNYCVLTKAELWKDSDNKVRTDYVDRKILRRSFFVWDLLTQPSWLKYEHLSVLFNFLETIIEKHVDAVPNDSKDVSPKSYPAVKVEKETLEKHSETLSGQNNIDDVHLLKPHLKDMQSHKINITVPADWSFQRQLLSLRGLGIAEYSYSIWNKLESDISPEFKGIMADHRWVALDNKDNLVSIYDYKTNNIINKIDPDRLPDPAPEVEDNASPTTKPGSEAVTPEENPSPESLDLEVINSIDCLKKETGRFIFSNEVVRASIFDSWNNLLNEIKGNYFNPKTGKKERKEWIRRLDRIRQILEDEVDITRFDRFAYESSFSLLIKSILDSMIGND